MKRRTLPENWLSHDLIVTAVLVLASIEMTFLMDVIYPTLFRLPLLHTILIGVLLCLPVALHRRFPIPAAVFGAVLFCLSCVLWPMEPYATAVAMFILIYGIGAWEPDRHRAVWVRAAICAAVFSALVASAVRGFYDPQFGERGVNAHFALLLIVLIVNTAYFAAAWVFGDRAWASALEREELAHAARVIEEQRREIELAAVELERVRIARELHDVVAHHVSAMSLQASGARRLLERDPERSAQILERVEETARSAIEELRALVHTLRDSATAAPAPTLDDLPALVAQSREAGMRIDLDQEADLPELSGNVSTALLRIAQEAITNARKHAGPNAHVQVTLRRAGADEVELDVLDNGVRSSALLPGAGVGIAGMRERAQAVGGTLEAGRAAQIPSVDAATGFLVRARVPVRPRAGTSAR